MSKPRILLAPHFRTMNEIFSIEDRKRLERAYDVVWGQDEPMPEDAFVKAARDAVAIVHGNWLPGYGAGIAKAAGLKAVFEVAGGHHHAGFDYATCFARHIHLGGCAWAFGPMVAEHALGLALAAGRNIGENDRDFRAGAERYLHAGNAGATMLWGKRVGFVGCGGLARSLQPLLQPFGVTISGYDPGIPEAELRARGIEPDSLEGIFSHCTFIFILAAPTRTNRAMITRALMERLPAESVLVLVSRAHVVDYAALTDLVVAGRFKAGIDVHDPEPLPSGHAMRQARHAVLTAHIAGSTVEGMHALGRQVLDDLELVLQGQRPRFTQPADPKVVQSKVAV